MKVAVFGGSGFLGMYLVKALLRKKYEVTIYDITPPVEVPGLKEFIKMDILDRDRLISNVRHHNFDFVYNLAGFASLDKAIKHPYQTMQLNVMGNLNVLDACVGTNVKRFLYASSAYAMSDKGSFYGISKLTSEKLVEEYSLRYGMPFTILRYGSVYAEEPFENNYIYHLVERAIRTRRIEHGGDGEELREYIHASDAAKLSVEVLQNEDFINRHVIFTGTEKMKRLDLFNLVNEILKNTIEIELKEGDYGNHYHYTPYSYTPTLSKKLVANPHIDMGQGILECIRSVFKNNPDLEKNWQSDSNH